MAGSTKPKTDAQYLKALGKKPKRASEVAEKLGVEASTARSRLRLLVEAGKAREEPIAPTREIKRPTTGYVLA